MPAPPPRALRPGTLIHLAGTSRPPPAPDASGPSRTGSAARSARAASLASDPECRQGQRRRREKTGEQFRELLRNILILCFLSHGFKRFSFSGCRVEKPHEHRRKGYARETMKKMGAKFCQKPRVNTVEGKSVLAFLLL